MKGFKDSDGKFRPISNTKGSRKKLDKSTKSTGIKTTSGIRMKKDQPMLGKNTQVILKEGFGLMDIPVGTKGVVTDHFGDRTRPIVEFTGHKGTWVIDDANKKLTVTNKTNDFEHLREAEENEEEAKQLGMARGEDLATIIDIPKIGTKTSVLEDEDPDLFVEVDVIKTKQDQFDVALQLASLAESNSRDTSPFEFTARRINELEFDEEDGDPISDAGNVFEDAVSEGISKELKRRLNL